jgi:hypothetical protein
MTQMKNWTEVFDVQTVGQSDLILCTTMSNFTSKYSSTIYHNKQERLMSII